MPGWLKKEYKLDEWIHIRNQVVHNGLNVPHRTANEIVNGVLGIMDKLNYFNVT
ncbi:MAG: hypothetical protein HPY74_06305 [Firmicutes bacterium]|nr:hypothetical protein [Bacillota bacterium]